MTYLFTFVTTIVDALKISPRGDSFKFGLTTFYIENVSPKQYIKMNGRIHTNPNGLDLPKAVKYTYTTYWLNLFWKQK